MVLTNAQLINYISRIKFTDDDKKKFKVQIENLIKSIETKIDETTDTKVLKVLQSGSWRKGTILKPKGDNPVDIDLVFFLDIDFRNYTIFQEINQLMIPILELIYPNKSKEDFWESPKTAGLEFQSSGLNVDIVPVRELNVEGYVEQPDKSNKRFITSPKVQLDFISDRKTANSNFSGIVRMLKRWKNFQEIKLSSFAIELIVAHLDLKKGVETNIVEAILRFFQLLGQRKFPRIWFDATYGKEIDDGSYLFIADPSYNENNVVKNINATEWLDIKTKANIALDRLVFAGEEEYITATVSLWKEIFDTEFNIDEIN